MVDVELQRWNKKREGVDEELLPQTITRELDRVNPKAYPNVAQILHLPLIIPVTTATVDRSNYADQ